MDLTPRNLNGTFVDLEPLEAAHRENLRAAAFEDPSIFTYMPGHMPDEFDKWFDWSLGLMDGQTDRVFIVRDKTSEVIVGSTRYLNISEREPRVEIGFTWYQPSVQGTYVNPEAKLLLLRNAFEFWNCARVEMKADAKNARSRAAMEKMGAKFEGILRRHQFVRDGYIRDSVYYSVLDHEWPNVRTGLQARVDAFKAKD